MATKQKYAPGSYMDIVMKNKKLNPAGYRAYQKHVRIEKWLDEEEKKHANDPEPDFGA